MTDDNWQEALQVTLSQLRELENRVINYLKANTSAKDLLFRNVKAEKKAEITKDVVELLSDVFADTTRFPSTPSSWTEFYPTVAWALVVRAATKGRRRPDAKTNNTTETPNATAAKESEEAATPQTTSTQVLSSKRLVHRPFVPTASTSYRAVTYKEPIHVSFAQGKVLTLDNFFYNVKYNGESAAVFAVLTTSTSISALRRAPASLRCRLSFV
ncbi:hypothetical protein BJ546DRAFT_337259 [Cryomyces antarcticus]